MPKPPRQPQKDTTEQESFGTPVKVRILADAVISWAKARERFRRSQPLGMASSRAALCRRADELAKLAFQMEDARRLLRKGRKRG